ncbi:hypothetical protein PMZ80_010994 [Knufia obscura]|uniref:Uncharacterized protein n=1 Tax=Knufia obscura TaxID=1635080 RepID=A0ABR0R7Y4_9EURO|nr:hypothetical protein PMZ80_010994 [Knufia obscura]
MISLSENVDNSDPDSDSNSDSSLPSLHDVLRPRKRSIADVKDIEDGAQQKRSRRQSRHRRQTTAGRRESIEIAESPSRSDYTSDLHNLGVTTIMSGSRDKGDSRKERTKLHKVHSGQGPSSSTSKRQLDAERRSYRDSQAEDRGSQILTTDVGEISVSVSRDDFLGVYGRRETCRGPEYCCLIGTWLRPEDGIPRNEIQKYDRGVAQDRRRRSLRKRRYWSDRDADTEVFQEVRRWKAGLV